MAVEGKVKGGVSKKVDTAFKKPLPKGGEAKEAVKEEVKAEAPLVKLSDSQMSEALTAFTKLLAIQVLQLYILARQPISVQLSKVSLGHRREARPAG